MIIFSIKNEKLDFFNRPIYCESANECLTYVQNILMSDADRALSGLKGDLSLYQLGEIDFVSGKISACKKPMFVSSLQSIFDTIPEDRVPRTEKQIREEIASLHEKIKQLEGVD